MTATRSGPSTRADHTVTTARQVDDTPFGGGAGMVLRVDVMDRALRGIYDEDPVELRKRRRVIALTPGGRVLDDAYVDELAAEEEGITLLCGRLRGLRRADRPALLLRHALDRALRAGRG